MAEQWKQIVDYPNYHISSFGNVKNIISNKLLTPNNKGGYYNVSLISNKNRKSLKVHRLVALAFIENPNNKPHVNHKDKNRLNNYVENLEWMTPTENNIHRCKDLVIVTNKNKPVYRISTKTNQILQSYNSIDEAALWAFNTGLTKNKHSGRNAISNNICGLSKNSYGFKWQTIKATEYLENELWKQIYIENNKDTKQYFVSNLGRFKNSQGIIMTNYKINDNGYIRVYIYNKTHLLHRLIALTFIDNPNNKTQVNHKDGNKTNNCVSNLEWVCNQQNQIHKYNIGLGNNFTRKIAQYDLNGNLIKEHISITLASKEVNTSKSNISGVLREKRKTAGGFIWKYLE